MASNLWPLVMPAGTPLSGHRALALSGAHHGTACRERAHYAIARHLHRCPGGASAHRSTYPSRQAAVLQTVAHTITNTITGTVAHAVEQTMT